ncbi:MAG: PIN domain-containing protein [Phycisphaerae bacterium]
MASASKVFVDTVALLALANLDDGLHELCSTIWRERLSAGSSSMVTSDWVLSEFLSGASRQPLRKAACRMVERLCRSSRVTIVPASRDQWMRAFDLYKGRPDKEWSLVDCVSILICKDQGVREVLTSDRHLMQAGLSALLR